ncbi:hypothetical protein E5D57_008055 [Metarhizium anisopliae]|nr:hypothetical protein E5D57_008055 [Metarhizium anisopliae]
MPPKRKALKSAYPSINERSNGKKAKPAPAQEAPLEPQLQDILLQSTIKRRQQRWAEVSGSKNLDINYQTATQNPRHAYEFICICNPLQSRYNGYNKENEAEDDGDTSDENEEPNTQACDEGKTCPCGKSAALLPSHPYTMTRAGLARYRMAVDMMNLRSPEAFAMYTFNDHMAYGALEVVQNMLLDFDEAYKAQQWREAWTIVGGMALFMVVGEGHTICMADDGEMTEKTAAQIARMVLAALAILDGKVQLADDTDTKNLGWMMALYQEMANSMQEQGLLGDAHPLNPKMFKFRAGNLNLYLQSYAYRCGITVPGVADISKDTDITMPKMTARPMGLGEDLFELPAHVRSTYAFRGTHRRAIGGDGLDISTWTNLERRHYAFDKKDPLANDTVKTLKEGLVLTLA